MHITQLEVLDTAGAEQFSALTEVVINVCVFIILNVL